MGTWGLSIALTKWPHGAYCVIPIRCLPSFLVAGCLEIETERNIVGCYLCGINRLRDILYVLGAQYLGALFLETRLAFSLTNKYPVSQVERLSPSWAADAWDSFHCFQSSFAKSK